jgi:hypothetical protein
VLRRRLSLILFLTAMLCFFVSRAANPLVFHNLTKLSDYITHSVRRFSL